MPVQQKSKLSASSYVSLQGKAQQQGLPMYMNREGTKAAMDREEKSTTDRAPLCMHRDSLATELCVASYQPTHAHRYSRMCKEPTMANTHSTIPSMPTHFVELTLWKECWGLHAAIPWNQVQVPFNSVACPSNPCHRCQRNLTASVSLLCVTEFAKPQ